MYGAPTASGPKIQNKMNEVRTHCRKVKLKRFSTNCSNIVSCATLWCRSQVVSAYILFLYSFQSMACIRIYVHRMCAVCVCFKIVSGDAHFTACRPINAHKLNYCFFFFLIWVTQTLEHSLRSLLKICLLFLSLLLLLFSCRIIY